MTVATFAGLTKRSNTSKPKTTKIRSNGITEGERKKPPFASVSFRFMGVATSDSSN